MKTQFNPEEEMNMHNWTEEIIEEVERLNNNTPDGQIIDADTILVDLVQKNNDEISGFAQDIFNIWKESKDRMSVEQMFHGFTGMGFSEYLMMCQKEITR